MAALAENARSLPPSPHAPSPSSPRRRGRKTNINANQSNFRTIGSSHLFRHHFWGFLYFEVLSRTKLAAITNLQTTTYSTKHMEVYMKYGTEVHTRASPALGKKWRRPLPHYGMVALGQQWSTHLGYMDLNLFSSNLGTRYLSTSWLLTLAIFDFE